MKKLLHDWLTGPNNDNYEAARGLFVIAFFVALGLQGWEVWRTETFDLAEFLQAFALYLPAGGIGIAAKDLAASKSRSAT